MQVSATEIAPQIMARRLEWADASALAGEAIEFFPGEGEPVTLRVVSAEQRPSTPAMVQFSIFLRGPADPVFPQQTYRFRHARLGDYAFLMTAVGRVEGGVDYEACFSHAP